MRRLSRLGLLQGDTIMVRIVVLEDGSWGPMSTALIHTLSDNQFMALAMNEVDIKDLRSTGFNINY